MNRDSHAVSVIRLAGLKIIESLVARVGTATEKSASFSLPGSHASIMSELEKSEQLVLEALLPFKEDILNIARGSLIDSEPQVTELATKICSSIAWWP